MCRKFLIMFTVIGCIATSNAMHVNPSSEPSSSSAVFNLQDTSYDWMTTDDEGRMVRLHSIKQGLIGHLSEKIKDHVQSGNELTLDGKRMALTIDSGYVLTLRQIEDYYTIFRVTIPYTEEEFKQLKKEEKELKESSVLQMGARPMRAVPQTLFERLRRLQVERVDENPPKVRRIQIIYKENQ